MKILSTIVLLLLLTTTAYSAECHMRPGQTPADRAVELTQGEEPPAGQHEEILACLALAAQIAETTVEGLRTGAIPFKALRYESGLADEGE